MHPGGARSASPGSITQGSWLWKFAGLSHCGLPRNDPRGSDDGGNGFEYQTASGVPTRLRDPAAQIAPGLLLEFFAPKRMRAQGKPGARCTRGLACKGVEKRTRAYRFSGSIPAFPAQWFYGLLRTLPGDRAFLSPSLAAMLDSTNLTPASRRQDHTTSPSATACASAFDGVVPIRRSSGAGGISIGRPRAFASLTGKARPATSRAPDAAASTASHPAFRDDREPPLMWGETAGVKKVICMKGEEGNIFAEGARQGIGDLPVGLN